MKTQCHDQVEDHEASGTGYDRVDTTVSCLLTRFRVRSVWSLLRCYRSFRRVRSESRDIPGLLASAFLVENPHTCYTLSLWSDAGAIREFNTKVRAHIAAANASVRDIEFRSGGPQLWSAQFRLSAVSPYNLRWDRLDLGARINGRSAAPEQAHER